MSPRFEYAKLRVEIVGLFILFVCDVAFLKGKLQAKPPLLQIISPLDSSLWVGFYALIK